MTVAVQKPAADRELLRARLRRLALPAVVILAAIFFSTFAEGFSSWGNIRGLMVNNFAQLAIVALALTLAIHSGGIDLAVATAIDLASLAFVSVIVATGNVALAIPAALLAAALAGLLNALLIAVLGIAPFLATLGTLFIGHSVQQLATSGGNPVYVPYANVPPALPQLARGDFLGLPIPVLTMAVLALLVHAVQVRSRFGRQSAAIGVQPILALYSGIPLRHVLAGIYVLTAVIAGITGIFLSANVSAYMPFSGNAFLMNAIGAAFIGTTVSRTRSANVPGTLAGVLFLAVVSNGLLLIGWDFYWQQLGAGVAILVCLILSDGLRRAGR
jgi:ribose transport system permease protein